MCGYVDCVWAACAWETVGVASGEERWDEMFELAGVTCLE
jgi:hypothetical protein